MPAAVALLLMQLGCAAQGFTTPGGEGFVVWVCPPPAAAGAPPAEEKALPEAPA